MTEPQIAVLIDFENSGLTHIRPLFDQLAEEGRIIIKRAYADWSGQRALREELVELGIEGIQLFRTTNSGKNSSDVRLTVDAVDLLHQPTIDIFVIVSSDSDFVPLASRIRAAGKRVIGAGRRAVVPKPMVQACDRYIYLDGPIRTSVTGTSAKRSHEKTTAINTSPDLDLLKRAINASMDEEGTVVGARLHTTLQRLDPSFDFKNHGHKTFVGFLESISDVLIQRQDKGDVLVEWVGMLHAGAPTSSWERDVSKLWKLRVTSSQKRIAGPQAAIDAAKVLGVARLKGSEFKTLQGLLDASTYLRRSWQRDGNWIVHS